MAKDRSRQSRDPRSGTPNGVSREGPHDTAFPPLKATVGDGVMPSWESQAAQYSRKGPPGISYFRGQVTDDYHVDCLLYRDEDGELVGILNHYPADFPPYEREADINVWVRPDRRRRGIGTALGLEAASRWEAPRPDQARMTASGARWVAAIERQYDSSVYTSRTESWREWREVHGRYQRAKIERVLHSPR
jgi:GNAT superfamily N-acetyltransferase